ncbi:hypothetical protein KKC88_03525 [Patescibacteria group bacterium]|nr:hypothetical protein [Patescibacteria group bacterium]MBU1673557.1 hypothetical protein [Patescibacteria group bacterium]MBU1963635.1 hypothetical protein [Patescibacteria group bacterium]
MGNKKWNEEQIQSFIDRAIKKDRILPDKIEGFRAGLEKGHVPFFTVDEIREAAARGDIPKNAVEDLIEIVERPDIAMFDPDTWKSREALLHRLEPGFFFGLRHGGH